MFVSVLLVVLAIWQSLFCQALEKTSLGYHSFHQLQRTNGFIGKFTRFYQQPLKVAEKAQLEHRHDLVRISKADPQQTHLVIFALKKRNMHLLEEYLMHVSTPGNNMMQDPHSAF